MQRRIPGLALATAMAATLAACDNTKPNAPANNSTNGQSAALSLADIGDPLYPDQPFAAPPPGSDNRGFIDPIVIRQCQVSLPETQNVPSKNDGRLLEFCTEVLAGEVWPPDQVFDYQPVNDPKAPKRKYRRLKEDAVIKPGQMIALLDSAVPYSNLQIARAAVEANKALHEASIQLYKFSETEWIQQRELEKKGGASLSDVRRARAQMDKAFADIANAVGQIRKTDEEMNKAGIVYGEHEVRSTIGGRIRRFYRKPGESVKALEPVAEVQNLDSYRIEGLVDAQHINWLNQPGVRTNLKVVIEPAPQTGPSRELPGHLSTVHAVAISKDPRKPLIVSASEDKTVRVWDRETRQQISWMRHTLPVRAVACTSGQTTENLCLTGADDGQGRLWSLDTPNPEKPLRELEQRHAGRIMSVAFAPDGQTCATADEREIILWDVATGKLRYRFPAQHRAPITSIQFTPQSRLVSSARDRTLCVWKLGTKGAASEAVLENRSGDVAVLGVSPDGQRVLFDLERKLSVLTHQQRTVGELAAPSEASEFSSFAIFSPDSQLVLAAGTGDLPLQLWKAPPINGRGSLIRRLSAGPTSTPTCAAFAPDSTFAVTGTQDHRVLIWDMPSKAELSRELTCELSYVDASIGAAERKGQFWANLKNPDPNVKLLIAGDTVTIVIPRPEQR